MKCKINLFFLEFLAQILACIARWQGSVGHIAPENLLEFHIAKMKFTMMNLIYRLKFSDIKYLFLAFLRVFISKHE